MASTVRANAPTTIEAGVHWAQDLLRVGQYARGLEQLQALAAQVPENRDVLYLMAMALRHLRRIPEALEVLARLEQLHPQCSRVHEERGHCMVFLKDAPRAIDAFLRAVNANPALPASWSMLAGLYRMTQQAQHAATAEAHVATLKELPAAVLEASALFADGELLLAENLVRAYLLRHGDHVEAMRLLARIGLAQEVLDDAQLLLEAVLELAPDYLAAHCDYALVLLERHDFVAARRQIDLLLRAEPHNRQYRTLYASTCVGLGEQEAAARLYGELLADAPQAADLHLSLAHALKTLGRTEQAVAAYQAAAALRPNFGDAYWSLANLKTYRFSDEQLARMRAEECAPATAAVDRYHLCFALGKALEDRGDYAESYRYYERGNALKRARSRYRAEVLETNTRLQRMVCTREFFQQRRRMGASERDPIFIIGLPRSGSTLIEQILASHTRVEGTQELADIARIVGELQGRAPDLDQPRYPAVLADLDAAAIARLGQRYLRQTRIFRTGKPEFIDKMPNNFRHLGLIHLMLPHARIIDARREPMACCFSNLKQLFASGQEFSYSIEDIARYYRTYLDLMQHWDEVLPGRILRVQHEDVVEDLAGSVRRILDYCQLDFEPACIEFYKTVRSVRTASSEQVRQPIFRHGLDQWRRYQAWLGPLQEALGDALVRYRA